MKALIPKADYESIYLLQILRIKLLGKESTLSRMEKF